jgi:hypothetical protein
MGVLLRNDANHQKYKHVNQQAIQEQVSLGVITTIETSYNDKGKNHKQTEEEHR